MSRQLFCDFETYFKSGKDGLSLRTSTYREYCTDPRFQTIGVALAWGEQEPVWYPGPEVAGVLASIDWASTTVCCHNSLFDLSVLHYIYSAHPANVICTQSLASSTGLRLLKGGSLDDVSNALREAGYNIRHKGTEVLRADGMRFEDFGPQQLYQYGEYCKDDVRICRDVLKACLDLTSIEELRFQSTMLKCGTEPVFIADVPLLKHELVRIDELQRSTLDKAAEAKGCTPLQFKTILMSNQKFSALLEEYGAEVPMKVSKTTGKEAPALAKSDEGMQALLEHDDINIQVFAMARLGNKSSDAQNKTQRMIDMAESGPLQLCYKIGAAHTGRLGATQGFNAMALPSGRVPGTSNACRRALMAPEGFSVGAIDSSAIEMRVSAYVANDAVMNEIYHSGRDLYSDFAATLFGHSAEAIRAGVKAGDKEMTKFRQWAKAGALSGVFGTGGAGFLNYAKTVMKLKMSPAEATRVIEVFRDMFVSTKDFWAVCDRVLRAMIRGQSGYFGGPDGKLFFYDGNADLFGTRCPSIRLPDGQYLRYLDLREQKAREALPGMFQRETEIVYHQVLGKNRVMTGIYGSKLHENLVQATAFAALKEQMNRINDKFRVIANVHDEAVFLVPLGREQEASSYALECFKRVPDWLGGCVLAGEVGVASRYGDC